MIYPGVGGSVAQRPAPQDLIARLPEEAAHQREVRRPPLQRLDRLLRHAPVVATTLIFYGIMFIIVENYNKHRRPVITDLRRLDYKTALIIGIFQVLSLVPGTSRSGATILGGLLFGASRTVAAEFTFFLAIPVMFGASALKMVKFGFHYTGAEILILVVGMVTAFIVSILSIKFLMRYIKTNDFKAFGWYRIALGIVVLAYLFMVGDPTAND